MVWDIPAEDIMTDQDPVDGRYAEGGLEHLVYRRLKKQHLFNLKKGGGGVRFLFSAITSTARAVSCKESQFPLGGMRRRTRGSGHKLQQQTSNIRRRFFPSKWLSTGAC